jgi:hypothetical protein
MAELLASEVLTVIAEISIALAGFAGVVVAFRQRALEALPPHEQIRLRYMLLVSCEALLFALLPFVPHYLRLGASTTWTLSSGALALGLMSLSLAIYVGSAKPQGRQLSRVWVNIYVFGGILAAIPLLLSCFGAFGEVLPGVYLAGLGFLLFTATSLFVRLVLSDSSPSATNSPDV